MLETLQLNLAQGWIPIELALGIDSLVVDDAIRIANHFAVRAVDLHLTVRHARNVAVTRHRHALPPYD